MTSLFPVKRMLLRGVAGVTILGRSEVRGGKGKGDGWPGQKGNGKGYPSGPREHLKPRRHTLRRTARPWWIGGYAAATKPGLVVRLGNWSSFEYRAIRTLGSSPVFCLFLSHGRGAG